MTTTDDLGQKAKFLRNAAPQQFNDFCQAFAAYTNERIDALIFATGNIERAQGQSQQCIKIAKLLNEVRIG
jgi:ABC-type amino acid transport substrate-binding protein